MTRTSLRTALTLSFLAALLVSAPAFAGGPLLIADPITRTPFAYAPGVVPVYTDLGNNGVLTGAQSDVHTATGFAEWTGVASSYFAAAIAGNFTAAGLPDIIGANAGLVVGSFNGGGIHVMYDNDGTITTNFFGAPPGVLGIASPDFAIGATLTESWALLNGTTADPADVGGISFSGIFTHEFGHSINLAHTQTNGAVGFFGDADVPSNCPPQPYSGGLTFNEFETMYPLLSIAAGSVGIQMATVNVLDDIASISNVYPTGGWPNNTGTITGVVLASDGVTEVTGVNVIARNLADAFEDAVSALSGDFTQGALGADGLFTLNGLTPGASYILYIDGIVAGGFSTSPATFSPEEYWNTNESNDGNVDDRCMSTAIVAVAGTPSTNNVIINGDPNDLMLGDDDFIEVPLPFSFPYCGTDYNTVFVGSNGFVTFGAGDADFSPTVAELLAGVPRIAPFWTDLSPNQGGSITALPAGPNFEITYNNVTEFLSGNSNNVVLTLRPDGTYQMDYGIVDATGGIAGRTVGGGAADPGETDLSLAAQPIGAGMETVYEEFAAADNDLENELHEWAACPGQFCVTADCPNDFIVGNGFGAGAVFDVELCFTNCGADSASFDYNASDSQGWCTTAGGTIVLAPGATFCVTVNCVVPGPTVAGTVSVIQLDVSATLDPSTVASCTTNVTVDATVPVAIQNMQAISTSRGVTLSWSLGDNWRTDLLGVQVQRSGNVEGPYANIGDRLEPSASMSFEDETAMPDQHYWYRLISMATDGNVTTAPIEVTTGDFALVTRLYSPTGSASSGIQIRYDLSRNNTNVELEVFDARGRRVNALERGPRSKGSYVFTWNGRSASGAAAARGVYFVTLRTDQQRLSQKVVLLR